MASRMSDPGSASSAPRYDAPRRHTMHDSDRQPVSSQITSGGASNSNMLVTFNLPMRQPSRKPSVWAGNLPWVPPSGVSPTRDEWAGLEQVGTGTTADSDSLTEAADPMSKMIGLNINNFLLCRYLRRKALGAAVQAQSWTRFVGGGTMGQTFRLREGIIVARIMHVIISLVVWQHFFYAKYARKMDEIPDDATNLWWKRLAPPIDSATMHMVLLQFALLPLTVSRSLLAWISTKTAAFPIDQIMTLHIQIGYTFVMTMVVSPGVFITYFAKLCYDFKNGDETMDTCYVFTSEIMATGYVILLLTYIIAFTAYYRGRLQYETFFKTHIAGAVLMYIVLVVHTLDSEFRTGHSRSQTFKWVIGSLAVYLADRSWRYITQQSQVPVIAAVCHADGGSVTLKLIKPWWFSFVPGQYIHLQVPEIDSMWHPFSIASSPEWSWMTLIIAVVQKKGGWTQQLAERIQAGQLVEVNIRGPFGNPIGPPSDAQAAANIIAVGTGTGIVPMVSLLKVRADMLSQLSGVGLARCRRTMAKRQTAASMANCLGANISPRTNEAFRHFQLLYRKRMLDSFSRGERPMPVFLKRATESAQRVGDIWIAVIALIWASLEVLVMGLLLSWSNLNEPAVLTAGMKVVLEVAACTLVVSFAVAVGVRVMGRSRLESPELYLQVLAVIAMVIVLSIFVHNHRFGMLSGIEQAVLVVFSLWRIVAARTMRWGSSGESSSSRHGAARHEVESFKFMWVTRSAELTIALLSDLEQTFSDLEQSIHGKSTNTVGTDSFRQLELKVFCTERRADRVEELKKWLSGTRFEKLVVFERPNFDAELVSVMRRQIMSPSFINRLPGEKKTCAVTFCGAPRVSDMLFKAVGRCGQLAAVAGARDFQFGYRTEFYGNSAPPAPKSKHKDSKSAGAERAKKREAKQVQWSNMRQDLTAISTHRPKDAHTEMKNLSPRHRKSHTTEV